MKNGRSAWSSLQNFNSDGNFRILFVKDSLNTIGRIGYCRCVTSYNQWERRSIGGSDSIFSQKCLYEVKAFVASLSSAQKFHHNVCMYTVLHKLIPVTGQNIPQAGVYPGIL